MDIRFDSNNNDNGIYFAAKPATETAGNVLNKASSFFNLLNSNLFLDKLSNMWRAYYGAYATGMGSNHTINFTGEQGELVSLPVNHFRNVAQHIYVMITANRPVMEARAINTDYKSLAQTYLANGVLEYYMREKKLEDCIKKAAEMSIVLGAGFVKLEWNATAGEAYDVDPDTGEFNYEGELEFSNLSPLDVIVDGTKESWNNDWILTRGFKNKFDLAAKYPEHADRIKSLQTKNEGSSYRLSVFSNDETDDVPVYEFYHRRTESMPDGRYILFVAEDVILLDTKMPYRVIPIFRITPGDILGTPYGYSPMFDIYPIQEMINSIYSAIATNQNAFAVQSIFIKRGNGAPTISSIEGGLNLIEGDEPPVPIQLTATPKESFEFLNVLIQAIETISGVNSVTRGNPEASLKSGTALALVQSMSLQFISGLQQSYVKLIEDVGTAVIQILKDFANTPKVVALVGKANRPLLKEFTGEQLSSINRVVVDVGNPLSRTIAGRVQMAEQMLQMNLIKTPQMYFEVMNTGRLDSMFEGEMSQLLLVKSENERLMEGSEVNATILDSHKMHIQEHSSVLADPDLRTDPTLVKKVLDHIQEHIDMLRNTDPQLLALIGETPLQPPPQPQAPLGMSPPPGMAPPPGLQPPQQLHPSLQPIHPMLQHPMGPPAQPVAPHPNAMPAMMASNPQSIVPANQQQIQGPGVHNQHLSGLPKVHASLLPNAQLQEQSMNNVKQ